MVFLGDFLKPKLLKSLIFQVKTSQKS